MATANPHPPKTKLPPIPRQLGLSGPSVIKEAKRNLKTLEKKNGRPVVLPVSGPKVTPLIRHPKQPAVVVTSNGGFDIWLQVALTALLAGGVLIGIAVQGIIQRWCGQ